MTGIQIINNFFRPAFKKIWSFKNQDYKFFIFQKKNKFVVVAKTARVKITYLCNSLQKAENIFKELLKEI